MDKKPYVISGEAPESDSEEEINYPITKLVGHPKSNLGSPVTSQGVIVKGEAPESDEEVDVHIAASTSVTSISSVTKEGRPTADNVKTHYDGIQYKTLLHKKLRERNISLHKNTTEFLRQTIGAAGKELNTTNQQLLRSQVQLQEAVSALLMLHNNTLQLNTKLAAITTESFLPDISIPALPDK